MTALIQVFEHERLTIHPDGFGRHLSPSQFEKLCQFNDRNAHRFFTIIRNGIQFGQYVGVIKIGNLTIEILPKADKHSFQHKEAHQAGTKKWQGVLMKMLAVSGELELESVSEASLRKRTNFLELYVEIYLRELELLLRKGLVRQYRQNKDNLKVLKGRLDFAKNVQLNSVHQERFFTTHQHYDQNHVLNQTLLKALKILETISIGSQHKDKIKQLLIHFPEISVAHINAECLSRIRLTRKTAGYGKALQIARMLILNYAPDISHGEEPMLALLFDMNKLWEKYIYKKLSAKQDERFEVNYQSSHLFWESRRVYPDLVVKRLKDIKLPDGTSGVEWETCIIDTKWKLIGQGQPSDDDLKQMYVYNQYWNSHKSLLLYPQSGLNEDSRFGKFHKSMEGNSSCKLGFVSVLGENGQLNENIAEEILAKLE